VHKHNQIDLPNIQSLQKFLKDCHPAPRAILGTQHTI